MVSGEAPPAAISKNENGSSSAASNSTIKRRRPRTASECVSDRGDPVQVLWTELALAFDRFCGTVMCLCILGCLLYAFISFQMRDDV